MVDYQLIFSDKRKTLGLQVKGGVVFVRAPRYVAQAQIAAMVKAKSAWLKRKIAEQQDVLNSQNSLFCQDAEIWIRGELKVLDISYQPKPQIINQQHQLTLILSKQHLPFAQDTEKTALKVKQKLEYWLKQQALQYIPERLEQLSVKTQLSFKSVKIRQYKSRWGSCNNRGELSFNYLLMMAPDWVVDYVIVHELCHLQYLNHSTAFWQLVARFDPNYLAAKLWLKKNQPLLVWR